jgi:hypothetical protein
MAFRRRSIGGLPAMSTFRTKFIGNSASLKRMGEKRTL